MTKDIKNTLADDLVYLGLMEKASEIYAELGEQAALSYIKNSHRLLSKVYHPDLNPLNGEKAHRAQQRLNEISERISKLTDKDIIEVLLKKDAEIQSKDEVPKKEKIKILVVEDEFGLHEIFREIFRMEGYEVRIATDGLNGLEMYQKFDPDLVLTDIIMPEMDGLELVAKIREINPQIKVIYMSGFFGMKKVKDRVREDVEKYGYLTIAKPFRLSLMLDLVKDYLG
ncbi:MAG TPA: response regulator [Thermodesulfobacteriota bacterium]|nr:response regulator [Thermodesulfobacteriota bacterium]